MMHVLVVVFTIVLVVEEAIILGGFSYIGGQLFPSLFLNGVAWRVQRGMMCAKGHKT